MNFLHQCPTFMISSFSALHGPGSKDPSNGHSNYANESFDPTVLTAVTLPLP